MVWLGAVVSILVVTLPPSFGCVAWCWGVWRFPLGGGLGVVVAIYVGSVKGGVGVGWWLVFGCG